MLSVEENDLLCRVEGDAPMGQLMRRHWIPACLSQEVAESDGTPLRTRLLGEDLVVFRDSQGRLGVLDEYCPHRRASLAMGRNEECGLRCLYHGWKFDVDGNVLEMSSEPVDSGFVTKVKHKAYPAREWGGFIWTYMGPEETMPEFEPPAFAPTADTQVAIVKIHIPCNWAQVQEGQLDSAHTSSLHSSDVKPAKIDSGKVSATQFLRPSTDKAPRIETEATSFGFQYAAIRRPIHNANTHEYVRRTVYIAPFTTLVPPSDAYNIVTLLSPTDDTHTAFHFIAWHPTACIDQEAWRKFNSAQIGIDVDENYNNRRTRQNDYLQDRNAMKLGHFSGIKGIPNQDIAMWETMGPIADRSKERLGASDRAVVEFRRTMVEAATKMRDGGPVLGRTKPHIPHVQIVSYEGVVPKSSDWRTLSKESYRPRTTAAE